MFDCLGKRKAELGLSLILGLAIVFRLSLVIKEKWPVYWAEYDFEDWEEVFLNSQYVSPNPSGWIPDEAVYSYAAGAYLRGANPILINPSQPPLGEYILALFISLFEKEKLAIPFFGLSAVVCFFVLAKMVFGNSLWVLFSVVLLVLERLFIEQFIYVPLLDIIQLVFIFLAFIFFIKALSRPGFFFLASLFLGAVAATKFWITAGLIGCAWLFFLVFACRDLKKTLSFLVSLPLSVLILAASYFKFFQEGGGFREFLGVQKWVFLYHKTKVSYPFSAWLLIFLNKWRVWWGEKAFVPCVQWQITWPISALGATLASFLYLFKKKPFWGDPKIGVIISFSLVYLLFLSVVQISPRYLIPLLPFSHLVLVYGFKEILARK